MTWNNRIVGYGDEQPDQLCANPRNWRIHPETQQKPLLGVLETVGVVQNVIVNKRTGFVVDGHLRIALALRTAQPSIPVTYVDLDESEEALILASLDPLAALAAADAEQLDALLREVSTSDAAVMQMLSDLAEANGVISPDFADDVDVSSDAIDGSSDVQRASLADRFLVPPFSVLDARQGYWQDRKRAWLALGIQSELGRGENALGFSEGVNDRHDNGAGPYAKVSPGGSPRDAATLGVDGRTVRGDGAGKPIPGPARTNGQDLMRGEHIVGNNLTWVKGDRDPADLDETSRKNLAGGRRKPGTIGAIPPNERSILDRSGSYGAKAINDHASMRDHLDNVQAADNQAAGTSVFDPVLCELAYRWFCPPDGAILDPFAGGSVRGIVASKLNRRYTGIDLSAPQIAANLKQAATITPTMIPTWITGDSVNAKELAGDRGPFDFVFSCPPYADLEVYSDDPRDLSTMDYSVFLTSYRLIIRATVEMLAPDRFACFVVGDVRDPKGIYRNFVSDTISAFQDAGAMLYNEAILVTAVGSLPIRVGRQFEAARKLGKTHQNVLVFIKGDAKRATSAIGPVALDESLFMVEDDADAA